MAVTDRNLVFDAPRKNRQSACVLSGNNRRQPRRGILKLVGTKGLTSGRSTPDRQEEHRRAGRASIRLLNILSKNENLAVLSFGTISARTT